MKSALDTNKKDIKFELTLLQDVQASISFSQNKNV